MAYRRGTVLKTSGTTIKQLRRWQAMLVLQPTATSGQERTFCTWDFHALVAWRCLRLLRDQGMPLSVLRHVGDLLQAHSGSFVGWLLIGNSGVIAMQRQGDHPPTMTGFGWSLDMGTIEREVESLL